MANYLISVNSENVDVTNGTTRYSTGRANDKTSLLLSYIEEKYIPGYLRPPRGSCHDNCKSGKKHDFVSGSQHSYLHRLGKKVHRHDPFQVNDLSPEERRKILAAQKILLFQDKPKVIMQKAFPQFKESRLTKQSVKLSLQTLSISHESTAAGGNEINSVSSDNEQLSKDDGNKKGPKLSPLQKARSSLKPNVLKETLGKRSNKLAGHRRFKQRALVPSKMVDTFAESAVPLKTRKIPMTTRSPRTVLGLIGNKNEGCKIRIIRDTTKMNELKSKMPSKYCKPGTNDLSSLNQRMCRHELHVMKNHGAEIVKHDKEKNEEKTIYAVEPETMNFGSECQQMSLLNEENVVSSTERTWELEIANLGAPQHELTESKCDNLPDAKNFEFETKPSMKLEISKLDSSVHESPESKSADFYIQQKSSPNAENLDVVSVTEKSNVSEISSLDSPLREFSESKCVDLCFPEQSSAKAEKLDLNCLQQKSRYNLSSQSSVTFGDDQETEESGYVPFESFELESENEESQISGDRKSYPVTTVINLEQNQSTDYKLRFRRGKTITNEPESNCPVRLKFQRTSMGYKIDNEAQVGSKCCLRTPATDAILENRDPKEQSIALRHQETKENKDLQGLLNIVIEETASKLAQSRKSKVKALVGAFETVISLRDKKPASTS